MIVTSDREDSEVTESEDEDKVYKYRNNTTSKKPNKEGSETELFKLKDSKNRND